MLMFHWFYGIVETAQSCWRYFKSVDKTKKMCWEETTSILHVHNIVTITYILQFPATNPGTQWEDDVVCPGEGE